MPSSTRSASREAFADVVCADDDWVAAEFDAIIAANFPLGTASGPPRRARRGPGHPDPGQPRRRHRYTRVAAPVDNLLPAQAHVWPRGPP